jgi:SH3-like domain-containing protein
MLALALLLAGPSEISAAPEGSGLPIPRFVTLRATEANMRTGPGEQYPIKWTYHRQGLPLEVTAEYFHWRRVRDWQGAEGWMHSSMLSSKRSIMVTGNVRALRAEPNPKSATLARIESEVTGKLLECATDGEWCRVEIESVKGWLLRSEFWGVFPQEIVN